MATPGEASNSLPQLIGRYSNIFREMVVVAPKVYDSNFFGTRRYDCIHVTFRAYAVSL